MIEQLNQEQREQLITVRDQWLAIGLDCAPLDKQAAQSAVCRAYADVGRPPPAEIVFCRSPIEAATIAVERYGHSYEELMYCYGQHEAGWLSYHAYMRDALGLVDQTEKLVGMLMVAQTCGWLLAYEHVVIISERPLYVKTNAQGRSHCTTGPAIEFSDGTKIYRVNGVEVPAEVVEAPDRADPLLILTDPNVERRAAIASVLGWHRVMQKLKPRVIDDRKQTIATVLAAVRAGEHDYGRLLEVDMPDHGPQRFLEVICPAHVDSDGGRRYIPVPIEMQTARQANNWTYREDEDAPAPEGRA